MHGRNRTEYKRAKQDDQTSAALAAKAQKWYALEAELQRRRTLFWKEQQQQQQSSKDEEGGSNQENDAAAAAIPVAVPAPPLSKDWFETTLELTRKALLVHPDPLGLWNQRRELLQQPADAATPVFFSLETELDVTQHALQSNPKSYGAWLHRKWSILYGLFSSQSQQQQRKNHDFCDPILQHELELTALFLKRDERNFHCWNYRRFIVSCQFARIAIVATANANPEQQSILLPDGSWNIQWSENTETDDDTVHCYMGAQIALDNSLLPSSSSAATKLHDTPKPASAVIVPLSNPSVQTILIQQEWEFTHAKIQDNFSNFSAFHYRAQLVPLILRIQLQQQQSSTLTDVLHSLLSTELQLVEQAMFTEPDDQTAWWYQRFLLPLVGLSSSSYNDEKDTNVSSLFESHAANLRELSQEVPNSKWVWLGLLHVLQTLDSGKIVKQQHVEERRLILETLQTIDSDRKERYKYLLQELDAEQRTQCANGSFNFFTWCNDNCPRRNNNTQPASSRDYQVSCCCSFDDVI